MELKAGRSQACGDVQLRGFAQAMRIRWLISRTLLLALAAVVPLIAAASLLGGFMIGSLSSLFRDGPNPELLLFPVLGYVAFFVLPAVLCMPLLLPWTLLWRSPRRIVVFRRFNIGYESKRLRRMLRTNFSPLGHVFTLADKTIHIPWFVRIPLAIGQLSLLNFRPRVVDGPHSLSGLRRLLNQRLWLNVNWFMSFQKVFPIRSSDELWRDCVQALLDDADLAVVDISIPRDTLAWEITECASHDLGDQMLFLASTASVEESRQWIDAISKSAANARSVPIFTYDEGGLTDERALDAFVMNVLARAAAPSADEKSAGLMIRLAGLLGLSVGVAVAGFLVAAPFLFGTLTARYSPLQGPVLLAYLYGDATEAALDRLKEDFAHSSIAALADYAQSSRKFLRDKGIAGLKAVGGGGVIRPLIAAGESPIPEAQEQAVAALRTVMQSLGSSGLKEYLAGLRAARQLPFDIETYEALTQAFPAADDATFALLLNSPSQAARFTAAFHLAAANDVRSVPVLLEAMRTEVGAPVASIGSLNVYTDASHRIPSTADALLESLLQKGEGTIVPSLLEPFLAGGDRAAAYAARFMIRAVAEDELLPRIRTLVPAKMRSLLPELAAILTAPGDLSASRVEALVSAPESAWLRSLLQDSDDRLRLDAALLLAHRGDPSGLSATLALLKIQDKCSWLSFGRLGPCYKFEERGHAVLDQLAKKVAMGTDLAMEPADLDGLSVYALIRLAGLLQHVGDDASAKTLIDAYSVHRNAELATRWPMEGVARQLAAALPKHLTDWTIDHAIAADETQAGRALSRLAEQMIRLNTGCQAIMLDNPNLWELARRCRQDMAN